MAEGQHLKSILVDNKSHHAVTLYILQNWTTSRLVSLSFIVEREKTFFFHRDTEFRFELTACPKKKMITIWGPVKWERDMLLQVTGDDDVQVREKHLPFQEKQICLRRKNMREEVSASGSKNLYEILGLNMKEVRKKPIQEQNEMIKQAYHSQMRRWHPDRNPGNGDNVICQEINDAYKILKDPEARAAYNNVADYDKGWLSKERWRAVFKPERYSDEQKKQYKKRIGLLILSGIFVAAGVGVTILTAGMAGPVVLGMIAASGALIGGGISSGLRTINRDSIENSCSSRKYIGSLAATLAFKPARISLERQISQTMATTAFRDSITSLEEFPLEERLDDDVENKAIMGNIKYDTTQAALSVTKNVGKGGDKVAKALKYLRGKKGINNEPSNSSEAAEELNEETNDEANEDRQNTKSCAKDSTTMASDEKNIDFEDGVSVFERRFSPLDYREFLKTLDWVEKFSIVDRTEGCDKRHLEIVSKLGQNPRIADIKEHFGREALPFISYRECSKREWFESNIFDEDFELCDKYADELLSLSWVKEYYIRVASEPEKSWQIYITYAKNTLPAMEDLKKMFGDNIALFVAFGQEDVDEDSETNEPCFLRGPVSGDVFSGDGGYGSIGVLLAAGEKHYATTCYHVCYKKKLCKDEMEKNHKMLKLDFANGSPDCQEATCLCAVNEEKIDLGRFSLGLYDDNHDFALIELNQSFDCSDMVEFLKKIQISPDLASKKEVKEMFFQKETLPVERVSKKRGKGTLVGISAGRDYPRYKRCYQILHRGKGKKPFANEGDSGSLVYLTYGDKKIPFAYLCLNSPGKNFYYCRNLRKSIEKLIKNSKREDLKNVKACITHHSKSEDKALKDLRKTTGINNEPSNSNEAAEEINEETNDEANEDGKNTKSTVQDSNDETKENKCEENMDKDDKNVCPGKNDKINLSDYKSPEPETNDTDDFTRQQEGTNSQTGNREAQSCVKHRLKYISNGLWFSKMLVSYKEKNGRTKHHEEVEDSESSILIPNNATNIKVRFQVKRFIRTWCDVKEYDRFKKDWVKRGGKYQPHIFRYSKPVSRTYTLEGRLYYEKVTKITGENYDQALLGGIVGLPGGVTENMIQDVIPSEGVVSVLETISSDARNGVEDLATIAGNTFTTVLEERLDDDVEIKQ